MANNGQKNLNLELISPSGFLFNSSCNLVTIPTVDGEAGIMQGHELIITTLEAGSVNIYDDKQNLIKSFEIKSGFAEMKDSDNLLVLVETA